MKNYNKKRIICLATILFTLVSIFSINYSRGDNNSEGIIITEDDSDGPITFNAKDIKMKNVGDTFLLEANVNSDASFKRLKFVSSDPKSIKVSHETESSCLLTKLGDFTELVYINITTYDPFDDFEAQVSIRSYNRVLNINMELEYLCCKDGKEVYDDELREVVLIDGASYSFTWYLETLFSACKNDDYFQNTYTSLEEEDLLELRDQVEKVFKNPISNFTVDESFSDMYNAITFDMDYETDIFGDEKEIDVEISIYKTSTTWKLKKYIPISSIDIDGNNYVL